MRQTTPAASFHRSMCPARLFALCLGGVALALASACKSGAPAEAPTPVGPAPDAGWQVLFDGQSLDGWRNYRGAPGEIKGWSVVDGTLARTGPGGDLMTTEQYGDFELELEWKISEGGNSGIMFRVSEDEDQPWRTGPEMQILDNSRHGDGKNPLTSTGANYALHAVSQDTAKGPGEWNAVRLLVRGDHVEHWLNGVKVVEYTLWDDDWKQKVAASKFGKMPRYGLNQRGHIVLQDHGDPVWFRNVRVRPL